MSAVVFHPALCYCVVIAPKSRGYIAMIPQYGLWFGLQCYNIAITVCIAI